MPPVMNVAAGLALLAVGGESLVRSSARLAAYYRVSPLVIGLTVVAFGTSAPELAVALQSVRAGTADLAVGNVIGSNIFNVLLILGGCALILPLVVSRRVVRIEVPIMIGFSAVAVALAMDGAVNMWDGLLLLLGLAAYLVWLLRAGAAEAEEAGNVAPPGRPLGALAGVGLGLGLLVLGADWLVAGAVELARLWGTSEIVIGLTIVAAGTSLPEVATSIIATMRGQRDLAVGNIVGSNIFNLTMILGLTAVAAGELRIDPGVLTFDFLVMLAVALACLPIFATGRTIARWEGALFVGYYVAYTAYLVLDATDHALLPQFVQAMVFFALPLTAVTLIVMVARAGWRKAVRAR